MLRLTSRIRKRSAGPSAGAAPRNGLVSVSTSRARNAARSRNSNTWLSRSRRETRCGLRCSQRRLLKGVCRTLRGLNRWMTTGIAKSRPPSRAAGARNVSIAGTPSLAGLRPPGQVGGQGPVVRLAGVDELVVDARLGQPLAVERLELAHPLQVRGADGRRVDLQLLARLQVAEQRRPLERELQLHRVLD